MEASIIIPAYNRRQRLEGTLRALSAVDYPNDAFEVVLVDDGSEDGTDRSFQQRSYPFRFHYLRHHDNRGRSAARNSGVGKACGRIVVFLDDDMQVVPNLVREHLKHHRDGHRTVVLGNIRHAPQVTATALIRYLDSRGVHKLGTDDPIPFRYFSAGNVSMEREFLVQTGLFDERFRYFGGEDLELGYRLHMNGARFIFEPGALAYRFDYRDIPELCRAMETFGRDSMPRIVELHPQLGELFRLHHAGTGDHHQVENISLLPSRFLRALLWPPWGAAVKGAARILNRLWAPSALFDYLILFHLMKGYRQYLRGRAGPGAASASDKSPAFSPDRKRSSL